MMAGQNWDSRDAARRFCESRGLPVEPPDELGDLGREAWRDLMRNLAILDQIYEGINIAASDINLLLAHCHNKEQFCLILESLKKLEAEQARTKKGGDRAEELGAEIFRLTTILQPLELSILNTSDQLFLTPVSRVDLVKRDDEFYGLIDDARDFLTNL